MLRKIAVFFFFFLSSSIFNVSAVSDDDQVPTASISAHVLDISGGKPAEAVQILAYFNSNDSWQKIGAQFTQSNGRVNWVSPGFQLVSGTYRLVYLTKEYYAAQNIDTFYPYIEVIFDVVDATKHYHVPLTVSPWGYSTYRGS